MILPSVRLFLVVRLLRKWSARAVNGVLILTLLLSLLSGQPLFQPPFYVSFFTNRSFKHYAVSQKKERNFGNFSPVECHLCSVLNCPAMVLTPCFVTKLESSFSFSLWKLSVCCTVTRELYWKWEVCDHQKERKRWKEASGESNHT